MAASRLILAEPPIAYRVQPPLVIDASIVGAVLFDEPECDQALARMRSRQLFAPQLLDYEITNVAVTKLRKGLDAASAEAALRLYDEVDIQLLEADVPEMLRLAARYQLSAYDAAYLWLAAALKAPLATFDRQLGKAATQHLAALG